MNGVLNLLKPPAMSSGQAVGAVRRLFGMKKVGHTGTLDPGAAGVLPICLGKATKLADYIMRGEKEYIAEATFGIATDTLDSYGSIVKTGNAVINEDMIKEAIPNFTGEITQRPPMYSAVKHEGRPLYKLARAGVTVEKPPRKVTIYSIELLGGGANRYLFKVNCSKGTYIRSLLADMAVAMGTCAYTSFLLRSNTCGFGLDTAFTIDELEAMEERQAAIVSMEKALDFMQALTLQDYLFPIVDSGAAIDLKKAGFNMPEQTAFRVYCKGILIGVGRRADDCLKIETKLN